MLHKKILLAGGGTAGHVEPALAVAHWIVENHSDYSCEFLGTSSGLEQRLVPEAGFALRTIEKSPMPRRLSGATLAWPIKFIRSMFQTWSACNDVDLVIGFGGYVSSSAYVVARLRGIPMIAHEANSVPGWANKLGVQLGALPLIAFESSRAIGGSWKNAEYVGIPLRKAVTDMAHKSAAERNTIREKKSNEWGFNSSRPIVLVFGGSLGSQHMNSVIESCRTLLSTHGIQVLHVVGNANALPASEANYRAVAYLSDLHEAYCAADLVICRSGAVTCHELAAIGSYALLVPLAIGNGEQRMNGHDLVQSGAAKMIDNREFTSQWLSANLLGLISAGKKFNSVEHSPQVPLNATERIGHLVEKKLQKVRS